MPQEGPTTGSDRMYTIMNTRAAAVWGILDDPKPEPGAVRKQKKGTMLAKRIIPCLDVNRGRVVKGINFLDLADAGDPVACALRYDQEGADELFFLDITASVEFRPVFLELIRAVAEQMFIPFAVGGGVRTLEDIRALLLAGADKVSINTAAVKDPELISQAAERFGSSDITVAIDAKRRPAGGWEVYLYGGRTPCDLDAVEWAVEAARRGAGEILLTSMDRDGTRDGYDLELTRAVSRAVSIPVIASGGCGQLPHLYDALTAGEASAVLAASIFHYQQHTIAEAKSYLAERGVPIRLCPPPDAHGKKTGHD